MRPIFTRCRVDARTQGRGWFLTITLLVLGSAAAHAAAERKGDYLVVLTALEQAGDQEGGFRRVAQEIAAFHQAETVEYDGRDAAGLATELKRRSPEHVLFVIPPAALDANVHRRVFLMCNRLDDDPLADFAFGYFTARDAAALAALWKRTRELHERGLSSRTWLNASVTTGMRSCIVAENDSPLLKAAGLGGPEIYFGAREQDPDVLRFVDRELKRLEKAGVIVLSGCGDPQGIWLFSDERNLDAAKHWTYEPAKVGFDPAGEMPRLTAARIAALTLNRPVVWNGVCHSAATRNVYVAADIVSTFGRVEATTLHTLDPAESFCLAVLDAGAAAYLASIGPNHGYRTLVEVHVAITRGATLGQAMRATYDDVFLATDGRPRLALYEPGTRQVEPPDTIMQSGGSMRLLIGDPALRPLPAAADPTESLEIRPTGESSFDVIVEWQEGVHPFEWDMYGVDPTRPWRVVARIALDELPQARGVSRFDTTISAASSGEVALPYRLRHAVVESHRGKRFLHLQANIEREKVEHKAVRVVFSIRALQP